jgi:hypothetical protein
VPHQGTHPTQGACNQVCQPARPPQRTVTQALCSDESGYLLYRLTRTGVQPAAAIHTHPAFIKLYSPLYTAHGTTQPSVLRGQVKVCVSTTQSCVRGKRMSSSHLQMPQSRHRFHRWDHTPRPKLHHDCKIPHSCEKQGLTICGNPLSPHRPQGRAGSEDTLTAAAVNQSQGLVDPYQATPVDPCGSELDSVPGHRAQAMKECRTRQGPTNKHRG